MVNDYRNYDYRRQDFERMVYEEIQLLRREVRELRREVDQAHMFVIGLCSYTAKAEPGIPKAYAFSKKLKDL